MSNEDEFFDAVTGGFPFIQIKVMDLCFCACDFKFLGAAMLRVPLLCLCSRDLGKRIQEEYVYMFCFWKIFWNNLVFL